MAKYNAVLLDFDGTVADTRPGIFNSIRYAMKADGRDVPAGADLDYFLGPPLYDSFSHVFGVDEKTAERLTDLYRVYYNEKGVFECALYDGIPELLDALRAAGIRTAVVSSKPTKFLNMLVPHFALETRFDAVIGPDLANKKADKTWLVQEALKTLGLPCDQSAAMVGDRRFDMEGAVRAGVTAVGALYGYGTREELLEAGAELLAAAPEELKILLT